MTQRDVFSKSEGDNYYQRNKGRLTSADQIAADDPILNSLAALELHPKDILEVGCSNGWRLNECRRIYRAKCFGIDPSAKAIADGAATFGGLDLRPGTADNLAFDNAAFDLVIFGFCLYLCDREDLFKIACEADRVLREKGHIAILDFYPPFAYRNEYQHQAGIYSYKMDYAKMFLWNPFYNLVSRSVLTHSGLARIDEPDERLSVVLLRKNVEFAYPKNPFVTED